MYTFQQQHWSNILVGDTGNTILAACTGLGASGLSVAAWVLAGPAGWKLFAGQALICLFAIVVKFAGGAIDFYWHKRKLRLKD